jgi:hypothetical protein
MGEGHGLVVERARAPAGRQRARRPTRAAERVRATVVRRDDGLDITDTTIPGRLMRSVTFPTALVECYDNQIQVGICSVSAVLISEGFTERRAQLPSAASASARSCVPGSPPSAPAQSGLRRARSPTACSSDPKTTDHHIQHIYGKIGTSTRAAAALWAMQHAGVSRPPERRAPVRYSLSLWECHIL